MRWVTPTMAASAREMPTGYTSRSNSSSGSGSPVGWNPATAVPTLVGVDGSAMVEGYHSCMPRAPYAHHGISTAAYSAFSSVSSAAPAGAVCKTTASGSPLSWICKSLRLVLRPSAGVPSPSGEGWYVALSLLRLGRWMREVDDVLARYDAVAVFPLNTSCRRMAPLSQKHSTSLSSKTSLPRSMSSTLSRPPARRTTQCVGSSSSASPKTLRLRRRRWKERSCKLSPPVSLHDCHPLVPGMRLSRSCEVDAATRAMSRSG
mmetsp:Transcript_30658/g.78734  ORF Transcript_30658/g.78734 Transcript_30658/m.78734 type:complete len:261 (+) Transcript_30658:985-1767(+)